MTPQENYGLTLAVMGRFEDALGALKKAEPPFGPSMESLQTRLGGIIYHILQTTYDTYLVNYIYMYITFIHVLNSWFVYIQVYTYIISSLLQARQSSLAAEIPRSCRTGQGSKGLGEARCCGFGG